MIKRSFALTINVGGIGDLEYQFTDEFHFDSQPPAHTITFDIKQANDWTYETSALALSKMSAATDEGFTWYGLDGSKMIFSIPDGYETCNDLANKVEWLTLSSSDKLIINVAELIGFDNSEFDIDDNIESSCIAAETPAQPTTTTTTSTTTTTTTTTTKTTTTKTTTKAPTPPPRPTKKCQSAFKNFKTKATSFIRFNTREEYDAIKIFELANGRKKPSNRAKLEIVNVEPGETISALKAFGFNGPVF